MKVFECSNEEGVNMVPARAVRNVKLAESAVEDICAEKHVTKREAFRGSDMLADCGQRSQTGVSREGSASDGGGETLHAAPSGRRSDVGRRYDEWRTEDLNRRDDLEVFEIAGQIVVCVFRLLVVGRDESRRVVVRVSHDGVEVVVVLARAA